MLLEFKLGMPSIIHGERNVQPLVRNEHLWFTSDGAMYVYYTPTHWREIPR